MIAAMERTKVPGWEQQDSLSGQTNSFVPDFATVRRELSSRRRITGYQPEACCESAAAAEAVTTFLPPLRPKLQHETFLTV